MTAARSEPRLCENGGLIRVPPHAARGVALCAGDEIYFGQVRLRFEC